MAQTAAEHLLLPYFMIGPNYLYRSTAGNHRGSFDFTFPLAPASAHEELDDLVNKQQSNGETDADQPLIPRYLGEAQEALKEI